jgi:hypothetical protein
MSDLTTAHADQLDALKQRFDRHAGDPLWHAVILGTSWERSPDSPDPWCLIAEREHLARNPAVLANHIHFREGGLVEEQYCIRLGGGLAEGRYFGADGHHLHAFQSAGDAAYRWLQGSPLSHLADRVIPPYSLRCYAGCWLGVLYLLAWEAGSPLLQARERMACEAEGVLPNPDDPGRTIDRDADGLEVVPDDLVPYRVTYAVLEADLFTASVEALRLLRQQLGDPKLLKNTTLATNFLRLSGEVWEVRYGDADEGGNFPDRSDSAFRHLARLFPEPNRDFKSLEFFPPPPGRPSLPHLGRDNRSDDQADDQALAEVREQMEEVLEEMRKAEKASNAKEATEKEKEFRALAARAEKMKKARRHGRRKKCGTASPEEKADHNLRVGFKRLKNRLRDKGLEKLADHLDASFSCQGGVWRYTPPPDTSPWQVTVPDQPAKK